MSRRFLAIAPLAAALLVLCGGDASASFTITSSDAGPSSTATNLANFDSFTPGSAAPGTSGGIGVTFAGTALAVTGSLPNNYTAPIVVGTSGTPFGDSADNGKSDTTTYLSTGIGSVTLALPAPSTYLGLLWGTIDSYNTLTFLSGTTVVGSFTGTEVLAALGNTAATPSLYVNFASTSAFTSVVASSTNYAFEFDNVAAGTAAVPEPASIALVGLGLAGLAVARRRVAR